jgi:hypothetical protein
VFKLNTIQNSTLVSQYSTSGISRDIDTDLGSVVSEEGVGLVEKNA